MPFRTVISGYQGREAIAEWYTLFAVFSLSCRQVMVHNGGIDMTENAWLTVIQGSEEKGIPLTTRGKVERNTHHD